MAYQTISASSTTFEEAANKIAAQLNELVDNNTSVTVTEKFNDTKAGSGTFEATITMLIDVVA